MARREENLNQIIRIDGKNCFMEALRNAFPIGKIQINFFQYDTTKEKGNKMTNEINIYLDFKDFDTIYYEIMHSGATIKNMNAMAMNPSLKEYEKQIILHRGGSTNSENPNEINARQLKIFKGRTKPVVLRAEIGKGQKNKQGGYTMIGSPERYVDIGMDYHDLEKLLSEIHRALAAYEVEKTMQPILDRKFEEINFEIKKIEDLISLMIKSMPLNMPADIILKNVEEIKAKTLPKPIPAYKQNKQQNDTPVNNYQQGNNNNNNNNSYNYNNYQNNNYQQEYQYGNQNNYQSGYYQYPNQ